MKALVCYQYKTTSDRGYGDTIATLSELTEKTIAIVRDSLVRFHGAGTEIILMSVTRLDEEGNA